MIQHLRWILVAIAMFFNAGMFLVIKFNDMKHLAEAVKEMKANQAKILEKVEKIQENQTAMKAVCDERHKDI